MLLSIDLGMDGNLALAFETSLAEPLRWPMASELVRIPEEVHRLAKEHG